MQNKSYFFYLADIVLICIFVLWLCYHSSNFSEVSMKLAVAFAILVVAVAMTFQNASAQSPNRMFGIGVNTHGAAELCYAVSPAIHIGTSLGIDLSSESYKGGDSKTANSIFFGPYGRFILQGTKNFKPYLSGQIGIQSGGDTKTGLDIGGGGFYFPENNVALFGQVSVVNLGFGDLSTSNIGIHSGHMGILWFFN